MRLQPLVCLCCVILIIAGARQAATDTPGVGTTERGDDPSDLRAGRFVYLANDVGVTLHASAQFAAVVASSEAERGVPVTPPDRLELDRRSQRADLTERGVTLFRVPPRDVPRGLEELERTNAWHQAFGSGLVVQPVFELGAGLRIPSDEVVVAFDTGTTQKDAKRLLQPTWDDLGLRKIRELRPATFVCVLGDPAFGRAFEVSRRLTEVDGVRWSQPSFINVFLETPGGPPEIPTVTRGTEFLSHVQMLESFAGGDVILSHQREPDDEAWRLTLDGHFESAAEDWYIARDADSNRILPVITRLRGHASERSVYMTGKGLAANRPPDPYDDNASSYLVSAVFEVTSLSDVFVEAWFRADFEPPRDAPRRVYDFGRILLYDIDSESFIYEYPIAPVGPRGDLTSRAGTADGWRRLLFRIPPEKRTGPMQLMVHFHSDDEGGAGGLHVDDIRVLGNLGNDDPPPARDPAAQVQYAIVPRGQIAGRPGQDDPSADAMTAWSRGIAARDVVVGVLDDGVERAHPDLAYWQPVIDDVPDTEDSGDDDGHDLGLLELWSTVFPGEPLDPADRHGTACAGLVGARANDGVGIAGVAPGALLLPLNRGIDDLSIVSAIDAAVELGMHVLVIPWGWTGIAPEVITQAITDAIDAGTIVVAAAGDGVHRPYTDSLDYPCTLTESTSLICVGASSIAGEPKGWATADGQYWWASSSDASGPDILAPGTWLHATDRRGLLGYNEGSESLAADWTDDFSGTGASACYAAGVAALMASRDPQISPAEVKQLITRSATRLPWATPRRAEYRLVAPDVAVLEALALSIERERQTAGELRLSRAP